MCIDYWYTFSLHVCVPMRFWFFFYLCVVVIQQVLVCPCCHFQAWFAILVFCTTEPTYNTAIVEMSFILVGYLTRSDTGSWSSCYLRAMQVRRHHAVDGTLHSMPQLMTPRPLRAVPQDGIDAGWNQGCSSTMNRHRNWCSMLCYTAES